MRLGLLLFLSLNVSCASLSQLVKNMAGTNVQESKAKETKEKPKTSFNNNKQFHSQNIPNRQYGRMDRNRFESEAKVNEEAGSLWVDEGQSSYLFSQNQKRLEGDVLNVMLETQAKEQLDNKISTIASLLKERKEIIKKRKQAAKRRMASENNAAGEAPKEEGASAAAKPSTDKTDTLNVEKVPSRVIATYPDGSYRVKGTRTIIIEDKEFKVMVSGLVRGSDIKDDAVASGKLLDSQFDIIKSRRSTQ